MLHVNEPLQLPEASKIVFAFRICNYGARPNGYCFHSKDINKFLASVPPFSLFELK